MTFNRSEYPKKKKNCFYRGKVCKVYIVVKFGDEVYVIIKLSPGSCSQTNKRTCKTLMIAIISTLINKL